MTDVLEMAKNTLEIKGFLDVEIDPTLDLVAEINKLKKEKNTELVEKVLLLCNEYIEATGQHDILTLKKEDLEEQVAEEEEKEVPVDNWDEDDSEDIK